jgi:hypothetical protein
VNDRIITANTGHLTLFPSTPTASTSMPIGAGAVAVGSAGRMATVASKPSRTRSSDLESAVYAHIQALRALGKTTVTPEEIARALGLPVTKVERALPSLNNRGVRVLRHA